MDLSYGKEYDAFRQQVGSFLEQHWPPTGDLAELPKAEAKKRFRELAAEHGYLHRSVPRRYGGGEQPTDEVRAQIIREEFGRVRAQMEIRCIGTVMLVPTLLERAEEWQKE